MKALTARQVSKAYPGGEQALDGIDVEVAEGEAFGLLGPNGAGKSTFVRCALDLIRPTSGEIQLFGVASGDREARVGVGSALESPRYPGYLTGAEFMRLQSRLAGIVPDSAHIAALLDRASLSPEQKIGTFSKGMLRQLAIAQALIGNPRLLLLDEPTADLDPIGRRQVRDRLHELKQQGVTVVLNSHLLSEVERLCDRVAIMHQGKIIASGQLDTLVPEGSDLETVFIDLITKAQA